MPDTRISDLTAATSVAGTDVYPSVQTAGVGPVKTSLTQITAFALANAPAGAVATPSIAPTGDTNTGFWFPAADTIAASTGGSERLRITSAGRVGIGVSPSSYTLEVGGNGIFNAGATFINEGASISQFILRRTGEGGFLIVHDAVQTLKFYDGTAGQTRMFINSSGNVGIGTTSPAYKLQVGTGANSATAAAAFLGGYTAFENAAGTGNPSITFNNDIDTGILNPAANNIAFVTNASERMRITSAGNVLIGTTSSPTTGTQCLTIETETAPTATPADTVTFYSSDLSAGNTMPSFYTEGTIVGTGTPTADRTIAVRINGTVYYLLASTIP